MQEISPYRALFLNVGSYHKSKFTFYSTNFVFTSVVKPMYYAATFILMMRQFSSFQSQLLASLIIVPWIIQYLYFIYILRRYYVNSRASLHETIDSEFHYEADYKRQMLLLTGLLLLIDVLLFSNYVWNSGLHSDVSNIYFYAMALSRCVVFGSMLALNSRGNSVYEWDTLEILFNFATLWVYLVYKPLGMLCIALLWLINTFKLKGLYMVLELNIFIYKWLAFLDINVIKELYALYFGHLKQLYKGLSHVSLFSFDLNDIIQSFWNLEFGNQYKFGFDFKKTEAFAETQASQLTIDKILKQLKTTEDRFWHERFFKYIVDNWTYYIDSFADVSKHYNFTRNTVYLDIVICLALSIYSLQYGLVYFSEYNSDYELLLRNFLSWSIQILFYGRMLMSQLILNFVIIFNSFEVEATWNLEYIACNLDSHAPEHEHLNLRCGNYVDSEQFDYNHWNALFWNPDGIILSLAYQARTIFTQFYASYSPAQFADSFKSGYEYNYKSFRPEYKEDRYKNMILDHHTDKTGKNVTKVERRRDIHTITYERSGCIDNDCLNKDFTLTNSTVQDPLGPDPGYDKQIINGSGENGQPKEEDSYPQKKHLINKSNTDLDSKTNTDPYNNTSTPTNENEKDSTKTPTEILTSTKKMKTRNQPPSENENKDETKNEIKKPSDDDTDDNGVKSRITSGTPGKKRGNEGDPSPNPNSDKPSIANKRPSTGKNKGNNPKRNPNTPLIPEQENANPATGKENPESQSSDSNNKDNKPKSGKSNPPNKNNKTGADPIDEKENEPKSGIEDPEHLKSEPDSKQVSGNKPGSINPKDPSKDKESSKNPSIKISNINPKEATNGPKPPKENNKIPEESTNKDLAKDPSKDLAKDPSKDLAKDPSKDKENKKSPSESLSKEEPKEKSKGKDKKEDESETQPLPKYVTDTPVKSKSVYKNGRGVIHYGLGGQQITPEDKPQNIEDSEIVTNYLPIA